MAVNWLEKISAFSRGPCHFLSGITAEGFLSELLRELRDDRASSNVKIILLLPLFEHPTLLCPSDCIGEETALELISVFAQCPTKPTLLPCHLLITITSVLVCTLCVNQNSHASQDFLDLLLQITQDNSDPRSVASLPSLQATACGCLQELEACCPGLLSQRLEVLCGLRHKEVSLLYQAFASLQTLVLRNCVYHLAQEPGAGADRLKSLLGVNNSLVMEVDQDSRLNKKDLPVLLSLVMRPTGTAPILQTGPNCKELRAVLSSLLEESYLLTPLCQAALLYRLIEVVAMVPAVHPSIFRAQLLRLLGTNQANLFHTTLLMKSAFTDSVFSADDEAFMLKRLIVLSQHPFLSTPEKLFYMDCILHFPENRPISCGEDSLPVLLTPQLASTLMPTAFNDSITMLARLNLISLVYLEEGDEGESKGLVCLYDYLNSLLCMVENGSSRELVVTFFRATFLFLFYFCHVEKYSNSMSEKLCLLYCHHPHLAPQLISLANHTLDQFTNHAWTIDLLRSLQRVITKASLDQLALKDLHWHLKLLARVAEEIDIQQVSTLHFLSNIIFPSSMSHSMNSNWQLGNAILGVCRQLLLHPSLDLLLLSLADILQYLACCYGNTAIQEHARLYYTLVTTVSKEKLQAVLAQGRRGAGLPVKQRSLSSIMADSEGLTSVLAVHQTEGIILRLLEHKNSEIQTKLACDERQVKLDMEIESSELEIYKTQLRDPNFALELALDYKLIQCDNPCGHFDQLFSIHLHFDFSDPHYKGLNNISVPCLFRERSPPLVRVRLKPKQPFPTILHANAIFTTQHGLTMHTILPDVQMTFQQAFSPLSIPSSWGSAGRLSIFEGLWDEIGGKEANTDCITSLFCCKLEGVKLQALVEKHFQPFLISDPPCKYFRVLLLLPPRSHLLLKISLEESSVHFKIATDDWRLLPQMNSFLLSLTSKDN